MSSGLNKSPEKPQKEQGRVLTKEQIIQAIKEITGREPIAVHIFSPRPHRVKLALVIAKRRIRKFFGKSSLMIVKLKIRLTGRKETFQYHAEAIEDNGEFFYRVGDKVIEITEWEFYRVIANPRLYYFSTALKLDCAIKGYRSDYRVIQRKECSSVVP
jgi:hypothetical protein